LAKLEIDRLQDRRRRTQKIAADAAEARCRDQDLFLRRGRGCRLCGSLSGNEGQRAKQHCTMLGKMDSHDALRTIVPFAFTTKATAAGIHPVATVAPARLITCEGTNHPRCRRHEAATSLDGLSVPGTSLVRA